MEIVVNRRHIPIAGAALFHFGILRTDQDDNSTVYAAGRHQDNLIKREGRRLYEHARGVMDTRLIHFFTPPSH